MALVARAKEKLASEMEKATRARELLASAQENVAIESD